ncbi:MAPEG family protein [Ancylobacter sonchi]|uniref:MAPEG family protein n=1 Tax=Ancylobacter TaxID=99 RepID=UPI001BD2E42D|nr:MULTISPECIES: MAPEG family protein [Ancylobacter]MBS7535382.1 MAPEG family protein [Ancylobacter sonchi]MCB4768038.1 MAPEG family protein [Ancylobacter sp. Lp-2]
MTYAAILMPVFAMVLLTFAVLIRLGVLRWRAVKAGLVADREGAVTGDERVWPVAVRQASSCFRNQFEVPVLFYVLSVLVLVTRKADFLYIVLAWIFVASRWVHAGIHCGPNLVGPRFSLFFVGVLVLMAMWLLFALSILVAPIVP